MRNPQVIFSLVLFLATLPCSRIAPALAAPPPSNEVAVIAGPDVSEDKLSLPELRRIVLGDSQFWKSGKRVTLLIRAPQARERDVVLKKVCGMSESQFRQHWIAKVFRAEAPSGPKVVNSNQTCLDLVPSLPGSLAFVDATEVPKNSKRLKVDGKSPGEKGYPLQ